MQVELKPMTLDVSDQAATYLERLAMAPEDYAAEIIRNHLEILALGEQGRIENRPDWQEAIGVGRAEIQARLGIPDEQADEWLKSQQV